MFHAKQLGQYSPLITDELRKKLAGHDPVRAADMLNKDCLYKSYDSKYWVAPYEVKSIVKLHLILRTYSKL